ncbi:unnamed protein product [Ilex paraguariensis]|uniref:Pseudouridine synthase I TruA alpha/beta domain-containing protein n=1 Tax=Ilex paraguariensis TaxID=185542 RepID=A0ABC8TXH9_9AQUA
MDYHQRSEVAESADPLQPETDLTSALQAELVSLRSRVKELEAENAKLSARVSNCRCQNAGIAKKKLKEREPGCNTRIMRQPLKRYVALKVLYFGQRFYGFASEAQMDPTVESEIFKALEKARLIFGDKKDLQYSRCGRTDKGVSSVGQVIALFLRSNCKEAGVRNGYTVKNIPEELYEGEIDYVRLLNRVLPQDIRVMGWSPAPIDFSARFSCLRRVYKYFFWREKLNILAMETAAKKFVGQHDFRNFCKMDAANVHNYRRHIFLFEILPCNERFGRDELWVIRIVGSAFLWHQVRCMVAVLFLIGQGLESLDVIDSLLDIARTPRKPQYPMAPEIPLVLQSCEFEDLKFMCSSDAKQALHAHLEKECRTYKLHAAIIHEALLNCSLIENDDRPFSNRKKKKEPSHVPLISRPTEPSYEERRIKWNSGVGSQKKFMLESTTDED